MGPSTITWWTMVASDGVRYSGTKQPQGLCKGYPVDDMGVGVGVGWGVFGVGGVD